MLNGLIDTKIITITFILMQKYFYINYTKNNYEVCNIHTY